MSATHPNAPSYGVAPSDRAQLHARLDWLLDEREQLERKAALPSGIGLSIIQKEQPDVSASSEAGALLKQGSKLLRDALGPILRPTALSPSITSDDGGKQVFYNWLKLVAPILEVPADRAALFPQLSLSDLFTSIKALGAGEIMPIFKPGKRGSLPPNIWTLSLWKLIAIEMKDALIALGLGSGQANKVITVAFGDQWDTIRKWRSPCVEVLGEHSATGISRFVHLMFYPVPENAAAPAEQRDIALNFLKEAGMVYLEQKRLAASASRHKRLSRKTGQLEIPES